MDFRSGVQHQKAPRDPDYHETDAFSHYRVARFRICYRKHSGRLEINTEFCSCATPQAPYSLLHLAICYLPSPPVDVTHDSRLFILNTVVTLSSLSDELLE